MKSDPKKCKYFLKKGPSMGRGSYFLPDFTQNEQHEDTLHRSEETPHRNEIHLKKELGSYERNHIYQRQHNSPFPAREKRRHHDG